MIIMRPNNADWNHIWQVTGDPSWRASNMQTYFRRLERCRYRIFFFRWLDRLFGWNPTGHGWYGWLTTERALPLRAIRIGVCAEPCGRFRRRQPLPAVETGLVQHKRWRSQ